MKQNIDRILLTGAVFIRIPRCLTIHRPHAQMRPSQKQQQAKLRFSYGSSKFGFVELQVFVQLAWFDVVGEVIDDHGFASRIKNRPLLTRRITKGKRRHTKEIIETGNFSLANDGKTLREEFRNDVICALGFQSIRPWRSLRLGGFFPAPLRDPSFFLRVPSCWRVSI